MQHKDFQLVPFEPSHADFLNLREEQRDCYQTLDQLKLHMTTLHRTSSFCKTLFCKGQLVLSVGAYKCWGNMYEGWLLVDECMPELFAQYPITGLRIAKWLLNSFPPTATRIQTHVRADFKAGQRFMDVLGFKQEGLMKKYGPTGLDYYLYSKIKD